MFLYLSFSTVETVQAPWRRMTEPEVATIGPTTLITLSRTMPQEVVVNEKSRRTYTTKIRKTRTVAIVEYSETTSN